MQRTRSLRAVPKNLSAAAAKRVVDFLTAAVLLSALLPFLTLVAALIRLDSRGPVFFRQERIGVSGRPFTIWKFRTMVEGAASKGAGCFVTQDDRRITGVGLQSLGTRAIVSDQAAGNVSMAAQLIGRREPV